MGAKNKIKEMLRNYSLLVNILSIMYNLRLYFSLWKYRGNNTIDISGSFVSNTKFRISGTKNEIIIGRMAKLKNCTITILGNNNKIKIGGGRTIINNVSFYSEDHNNHIIIGEHFTMEGGHIASTEGENITIGNDCMFSGDIEIRNGDSHSIIKEGTQKRTNWAKSVLIGNHVWLAAHVRVLKGSIIPPNSIVGNSSVVLGKLTSPNSIYVGNPAKLVKDQINWDRDRYKFLKK